MINKKLFVLSFLMSFAVLVGYLYAADGSKNYVALLNGATHTVVPGNSGNPGKSEYSFIGQSVVFDEKGGKDAVSRSAFASAFYIVQSSSITITNNTEDKVYEDIKVPLEVNIKSTIGKITKIKYRVWQGENPDWNDYTKCPEIELSSTSTQSRPADFTPSTDVTVISTYNFSMGQQYNYFKFYAQTENDAKRWSEVYRVMLTPDLSADIKFTSPDDLTGIASLDPKIETTKFSLNYKPVTISLYKGDSVDPDKLMYEVKIDTSTNYQVYDSTNSMISCNNSDLIKISSPSATNTNLQNNEQYTLRIIPTRDPSKEHVVKFKAVSDGVADILTYPSPFNPKKQKIKIRYVLANKKNVTIRLYDKAGKVVCKLVDGEERSAGTNEEEWDGKNYAGETLATGAYIVEIIAGSDRRYTALAIVGK